MVSVLWLFATLAQAAEPTPPDRWVRCTQAGQIKAWSGELDPRIDPAGPIEAHLRGRRVVGSRFVHVPEGREDTLRSYGYRDPSKAGAQRIPVAVKGDVFTIGVLTPPARDGVMSRLGDEAGCWIWEAENDMLVHLPRDGQRMRVWLGAETAGEAFRVVPASIVASPPAPMRVPRVTEPASVFRLNVRELPERQEPERKIGLFDISAIDVVLPMAERCEPFKPGAYLLSTSSGMVMHCPGGDPKIVDALLDEVNRGPMDVAKKVDGVWDLGMRLFDRYAVADEHGVWLASDLELLEDVRNASGTPAWEAGADAPGLIIDAPQARIRFVAQDGLLAVEMASKTGRALTDMLPARLPLSGTRLLPTPEPVVGGVERVVRRTRCDMGDLDACARDASRLRTSKDYGEARKYADKACKGGVGIACYILGAMLASGEGGQVESEAGLALFQRGCELDSGAACWAVGSMYGRGEGVKANEGRADGFMRKGCDLGYGRACGRVAHVLVRDGAAQSDPAVMELRQRACDGGDYYQCLNLAESAILGGDDALAGRLLEADPPPGAPVDVMFNRAMLQLQRCDTMACTAEVARRWERLPDEPALTYDWSDVIDALPADDAGRRWKALFQTLATTPRDAKADTAFYAALEAVRRPSDADGGHRVSEPSDPPPVQPCLEDYLTDPDPTLLSRRGFNSITLSFLVEHVWVYGPKLTKLPKREMAALFMCGVEEPSVQVVEALIARKRLKLVGVSGRLNAKTSRLLGELDAEQLYVASEGLKAGEIERLSGFGGEILSLSGVERLDEASAKAVAGFSATHPELKKIRAASDLAAAIRLEHFALHLDGVVRMDAGAATALASYYGGVLSLRGLSRLDDGVVEGLAQWRGAQLDLSGLTSITPSQARALAGARLSTLRLDGLTRLTPDVARELGRFRGMRLHLNGVVALDEATSGALVEDRPPRAVRNVSFDGLSDLSPEVARDLLALGGHALELGGLERLDGPTAAVLFTQHRARHELGGLTRLDLDGARTLVRFNREPNLPALSEIDVDLARVLAGAKGWSLKLGGSSDMTPAVASELCRYENDLTLHTVTELTVPVAEVLGACEARSLRLPGLKSLSPEAARALTRFFEGDLYLSDQAQTSAETRELLRQARADVTLISP